MGLESDKTHTKEKVGKVTDISPAGNRSHFSSLNLFPAITPGSNNNGRRNRPMIKATWIGSSAHKGKVIRKNPARIRSQVNLHKAPGGCDKTPRGHLTLIRNDATATPTGGRQTQVSGAD